MLTPEKMTNEYRIKTVTEWRDKVEKNPDKYRIIHRIFNDDSIEAIFCTKAHEDWVESERLPTLDVRSDDFI